MKKTLLSILAFAASFGTASAVDNNTVEIKFNGTSATVSMASNISSYVSVSSGTSSHVVITQADGFAGINPTVDNEDGEIIYVLSGTSTNGSLTLYGSFKCVVELNGLTLTNPSGPAINIQNGKRIEVSAKKGTTNTLSDGANADYNGCLHVKGHTKLKGKGTLNIIGNSKHALYSKEYVEVKNLTLNITAAKKDGIHCKEYFLMESGTVVIKGVDDDAIQVELDGTTSTGTTTDHEDEDTGNFYMTGGTLTLSNYGGKAIKADGAISYSGGTRNFSTTDTETYAGISETVKNADSEAQYYDLSGRKLTGPKKGIVIMKRNGKTLKINHL